MALKGASTAPGWASEAALCVCGFSVTSTAPVISLWYGLAILLLTLLRISIRLIVCCGSRIPKWRGSGARNYRPCFRENQPKRSFSIKWKRAFWACFRENRVYKFGHGSVAPALWIRIRRILIYLPSWSGYDYVIQPYLILLLRIRVRFGSGSLLFIKD